jgi:metal-responsive CopG/Arc/MetJ family transcriptional regulator
MENNKTISVSIPKKILSQIDTNRGDITRSKFILRLIESKNALGKQQQIPEI